MVPRVSETADSRGGSCGAYLWKRSVRIDFRRRLWYSRRSYSGEATVSNGGDLWGIEEGRDGREGGEPAMVGSRGWVLILEDSEVFQELWGSCLNTRGMFVVIAAPR